MPVLLDIFKKQIRKGQETSAQAQAKNDILTHKTFFETVSSEILYQGTVYGICSGFSSEKNKQDIAQNFSTSFEWPVVLGAFTAGFLVEYGINKAFELDTLHTTTAQKLLIYGTESAISAYHGYKKYGTPLQTALWALYCSPGYAIAEGYAKPNATN